MMHPRISTTIAGALLWCAATPLLGGFSGTDLFLASVGRGPGASNSQWYTTVWISNQSAVTATVQVMFLERKQANPSPVTSGFTLPAGWTARYDDILWNMFGFDNKFGALRFVSDQKIVVTCRIFNLPAGGTDRDTQGQDYAGIPASFGISKGQSTHLLGVYQTSTDKSVSPFRYSFGLAESAGGTASVHVKALDAMGAVVAEKDYGPLGAYEVEYYPIEDLSASISSQNLRLEVSMTDGTGKVIAVGSGVANQSNDGTTFEMKFADSLLGGGGGGGLSSVAHDLTLDGDGTLSSPLGIASGAVVRSLNGLKDTVTLAAGTNITITPAGNTLTIAATGGGGGGGSGVPSVNGITSAVTINGTGTASVGTSGNTITVNGAGLTAVTPGTGLVGNGTIATPLAIANLGVGTAQIANLAVGTAQLADAAVTKTKLSASGGSAGQVLGTDGSALVWQASGGGLTLPYSGSASDPGGAFQVTNTGSGDGIRGNSTNGYGVSGSSTSSVAVYGLHPASGNFGYLGSSVDGVYGFSSSGYGVHGSSSSSGRGVYGFSSSGDGVYGSSTSGYGVYGSSTNSVGVYGLHPASGNYGYLGSSDYGVFGSSSGSGYGVYGQSDSGRGVYGGSNSSRGVVGASSSGDGVYGYSTSGSGVYGSHLASGNYGYLGISNAGVSGTSTSGDGVYGSSSSGKGVWGRSGVVAVVGTNTGNGNYAELGGSGEALHAVAFSGDSGFFQGHVTISGGLDVSGGTKNFRIDHPLDPENRYLVHAAVESSEVLNVYSGNVVTDGQGIAVVPLPDWFEAANTDFRYQLTVIGRFAQAIIERKIENNRFTIRTNLGGIEVSWQVISRRNDAWMRAHPFEPELEKPAAERGTYLTPIEHGQPPEKSVESVRHPALIQPINAAPEKSTTGKP